ncbi:hypothetical protein K8P63_18425 [Sphingomonas nostoxanthinifaciens]|nr:hypothetical protein K8P63_18425 [Sphingomonas nostoxanthinifaciens]
MAGIGERIDVRLPHRHDLALYANLHAVERERVRPRRLDVEIGAARKRANVVQDDFDPGIASGDRAIDALVRDQERALDAVRATDGSERVLRGVTILERRELVEGGDPDGACGLDHGDPGAIVDFTGADEQRQIVRFFPPPSA